MRIKMVAAVSVAFIAGMFVTPDILPAIHTYGISAGTQTRYCSADLVGWHPSITCQAGK